MLISAAPRSGLRRGLVALAAAVLVAALPARADELQDATKLLKAGQHQQALERVNKLLSSKPRDPQARFLKGLILTEQGNTREAIEIFSKLTQDFPELPEPYNNLGDLRLAGAVREGAHGPRAVYPHASQLCHRIREPRRRLRQAREPGLRQGPADRFVQRRRAEQALAG